MWISIFLHKFMLFYFVSDIKIIKLLIHIDKARKNVGGDGDGDRYNYCDINSDW